MMLAALQVFSIFHFVCYFQYSVGGPVLFLASAPVLQVGALFYLFLLSFPLVE
jgi:hypothetical protein